MTFALQDFLDKLPDEFLGIELQLSGARVESQLKYLKHRFPLLPYDKQAGLAILLQHITLDRFTDEEILEVAKLNFSYLETILFPEMKSYFSPDAPLQDTGSTRIYSLLNVEEVSVRSLQVSFAHFNLYEAESLKELITDLYYLGA